MKRGAAGAAALLLLAGCAQLLPARLGPAIEFELLGRIAVQFGGESSSGQLAWRHGRADDEILISSPLGQGVAKIVRQDGAVTLTTAEAREYRAQDAEQLTEQVLGYRLPLAGLADWVRGRPSPEGPSALAEYDLDGRLAVLQQGPWRIEYLAYDEALRLPSRMRLVHPGVELRLAVSSWKLPP